MEVRRSIAGLNVNQSLLQLLEHPGRESSIISVADKLRSALLKLERNSEIFQLSSESNVGFIFICCNSVVLY